MVLVGAKRSNFFLRNIPIYFLLFASSWFLNDKKKYVEAFPLRQQQQQQLQQQSFRLHHSSSYLPASSAQALTSKRKRNSNIKNKIRQRTCQNIEKHFSTTFLLGSTSNGENNEVFQGKEESKMNEYIANFLDKNKREADEPFSSDDINVATHLIAIPMDSCHELLIELESVQRAILYHCPVLVDACIAPSTIRLPLLYVQTPSGIESNRASIILSELTKATVNKHMSIDMSLESNNDNDDDEGGGIVEIDPDSLNEDGILPLSLSFQSLEIDGKNNNVLQTVAQADDKGTARLCALVEDLQSCIEQRGWKTALPSDPNNENSNNDNDNDQESTKTTTTTTKNVGTTTFRPRIAFMELPQAFDDKITYYKAETTEIKEEDIEQLQSENGGNGISPIFWGRWLSDIFGRDIRLREIGIYPRRGPRVGAIPPSTLNELGVGLGSSMLMDEQFPIHSKFFLPYESVPLPEPNAEMLEVERKFEKYNVKRKEEQQRKFFEDDDDDDDDGMWDKNENDGNDKMKRSSSSSSGEYEEPDILMTKTRKRLEEVYENSATDDSSVFDEEGQNESQQKQDDVTAESKEKKDVVPANDDDEEEEIVFNTPEASPDDFIDDWTTKRIRATIEARAQVRKKAVEKKDMPPIEDNPIFKAYKEGTLVPKSETKKKKKKKELPPYPSREHFVGFWKFGLSPTGLESSTEGKDGTASENLVLRVDGTTMGGPILDPETRSTASGGTWRMIEKEEDGEVRLNIRLVIPPEKERILEMDGLVGRTNAELGIPEMASTSFGIPFIEQIEKEAKGKKSGIMMFCNGEVHIEDAITKKNRERIGTFSLTKLQGALDDGEYTITIPSPVRKD